MRRIIAFFWIGSFLTSLWSEYWPTQREHQTWAQVGSPIDPDEVGGVQRKRGPIDADEVGGVQRKKGPIDADEVGGVRRKRNPNEIGNTVEPPPENSQDILKQLEQLIGK
jgi:hypothetical protein